ncbi:MAG: DivIVA domain-containing protein [Proteobacteria bacterium]|nr:DivIVA domain-containing protein [Desulfobulbaceae bacterium]MBU4154082.1 DivIVA domain-containing protein [Pseudomonadota bacterium]MDP2106519.1 DivIVA domain-containing protein [Desulfobulbaceae bacterium]
MTLTPEDIQSKQFHVRFRGFDVEEVDGFLEQVAENFLMLNEENRTLKTKIESMTQDLEVFKQDESSFKNAILSAQKVADEMKKKSRNDANRMLTQAHAEVTQLKDEANREIAALESKVDQLKGMESRLITDLRGVLNDYLTQLESQVISVSSGAAQPSPTVEVKQPVPARKQEAEPPLYEKITVEDVEDSWLSQAEADLESDEDDRTASRLSGPAIGGLDLEDEGPSVTIPDMDDDVMFTLDDPLDVEVGRRRR